VRNYSLKGYGQMLTTEARISAYAQAIRAAIRPGDVVLDIGTGTGVMAMLACQCGAQRVYALEPSDAIVIARQAAKDNGFADRIIFHREFSTALTLPERCDVLLSDLRGSSPCYSSHLADLLDARSRLLKPDARWICQADTLSVAVIDVPQRESQLFPAWDGSRWGLDLGAALPFASNQISRHFCAPSDLLGPARTWAQINYPKLSSPHVRGETTLTIERCGSAHGLQVWFEAELFGGARFSNSPGTPDGVYSRILLPWPEVVQLQPNDLVHVQIDAMYTGRDYCWNWRSTVRRTGLLAPLAAFNQSTLKGQLLEPGIVERATKDSPPLLTAEAEETRFVLGLIDGKTHPTDLAAALQAKYPNRYANEAVAAVRIGQICAAYTRH
jgi:protein arginine N-methyltransferase 1